MNERGLLSSVWGTPDLSTLTTEGDRAAVLAGRARVAPSVMEAEERD